MKRIARIAALAAGLVLIGVVLSNIPLSGDGDDGLALYVADPVDCVVGLDQPRQLQNPAHVDHPRALEATPPVREMRRRRIDPDSAEGIILRSRGEGLVRQACQVVMDEEGFDSVWRRIRRRDGVPIPDVTARVIARVEVEADPPALEAAAASGGR